MGSLGIQRKSALARVLFTGCASLVLGACYHARVAAPNVANLNEPVSVTKVSLLWGLAQSRAEDTTCTCLNNGIKEVTSNTNFGYLLLGVVTLGIVVPTELEYVCGKPPPGGQFPDPPRSSECPNIVTLPPPPSSPAAPSSSATPTPAPSSSAPMGPDIF